MTDRDLEKAREIGEHIFRWGLSCKDCTPEDFKIEMAKAVKQLKQFFSLREKEVREELDWAMRDAWKLHPSHACISKPQMRAMLEVREKEVRADQIEKDARIADNYWKFDNDQQPRSTWHDKQDCLEAIRSQRGDG